MKMGRRLILFVAFITIVIVILGICFVSFHIYQVGSKEYHINLKYSVKITSELPDTMSLYLPIPLKEGGKQSEVVENIQTSSGEYSWQVTNTEKGTALMLNGRGNISLLGTFEIKRNYGVYQYDATLSMAENRTTDLSEEYYIWIWKSSTSHQITVNISYKKNMGSDGCSYTAKETIDALCINGWQKMKVKVEIVTT